MQRSGKPMHAKLFFLTRFLFLKKLKQPYSVSQILYFFINITGGWRDDRPTNHRSSLVSMNVNIFRTLQSRRRTDTEKNHHECVPFTHKKILSQKIVYSIVYDDLFRNVKCMMSFNSFFAFAIKKKRCCHKIKQTKTTHNVYIFFRMMSPWSPQKNIFLREDLVCNEVCWLCNC